MRRKNSSTHVRYDRSISRFLIQRKFSAPVNNAPTVFPCWFKQHARPLAASFHLAEVHVAYAEY